MKLIVGHRETDASHEGSGLTPSTHRRIVALLIPATVAFLVPLAFRIDIWNRFFTVNCDWDPCYLRYILSQDFFEFHGLWSNSVGDQDMIKAAETSECYSPVVEDISLGDNTLYDAVAQIEKE